jgi:hypothetical protein
MGLIVSAFSGVLLLAVLIWLNGQAEERAKALADSMKKAGRLKLNYNQAVTRYKGYYRIGIGVFIAAALYKILSSLFALLQTG